MSIRSKRNRRIDRRLLALRRHRWLLRYDFERPSELVICDVNPRHLTAIFCVPVRRSLVTAPFITHMPAEQVVLKAHLLRGEVGVDRHGPIGLECLLYLEQGTKPTDADCERAERVIRKLSRHQQRAA